MAKFVTLDAGKKATGFYDSEVHGDAIPKGAVPISLELWREWVGKSEAIYSDGRLTYSPETVAAALRGRASLKVRLLLATVRPYSVDDLTVYADATSGTVGDLRSLELWGQANPTTSKPWIAEDHSVTPLTGAQFTALSQAAWTYQQSVYDALAEVLEMIALGVITEIPQIDSYAWPV